MIHPVSNGQIIRNNYKTAEKLPYLYRLENNDFSDRMRKLAGVLVFFILSTALQVRAQFTDSNLPIVIISTNGGASIQDEPRIRATMKIIYNDTGTRNYLTEQNDPGKLNYNGQIEIEIRGSSSQNLSKKQYALTTLKADNTNNNVSLLGMPKENDWVLNGLAFDASLLRDYLSYNLSLKIGNYAPRQRYCEVMINGVYSGLYILQEKVKIDDNRVNIAKIDIGDISLPELSGGYLVKADKVSGNDVSSWTMATYLSTQVDFIHESPKTTEISDEQNAYIKNTFYALASAATSNSISKGFPSVIDVPSFVDFMIINELASNVDAYQFSTYFHKERQGKLRAGPLWDLNLTYGNDLTFWNLDRSKSNVWQFDNGDNVGAKFWRDLFKNSTYRCYMAKRWNSLTAPGQPLHIEALETFIDEIVTSISEAAGRENERWSTIGDHTEQVDAVKTFLSERISWMTDNLGSFTSCSNISQPSLVISRINYHPEDTDGNEEPEFIEITNSGSSAASLTGIYCSGTGIGFQFETGSALPANGVIQITNDKNGFKNRYGYQPFGGYARKLSNGTQKLTLADAFGNVIDEVEYSDATPWPDADGNGSYLKLVDLTMDNNAGANWISSSENISSTETVVGILPGIEGIEIIPNPTDHVINIKSPEIIDQIYVTDIAGKRVETFSLNNFQTQVDLGKYPTGMYLLVIQSGNTVVVRKVARK